MLLCLTDHAFYRPCDYRSAGHGSSMISTLNCRNISCSQYTTFTVNKINTLYCSLVFGGLSKAKRYKFSVVKTYTIIAALQVLNVRFIASFNNFQL